MKKDKEIEIKSIKSGSKKLQELFEGLKSDTKNIEDDLDIAHNLQSYENYLNRNAKKKKQKN